MWTVTLALRPVIVSLHLLGGMATLALLVWLAARLDDGAPPLRPPPPAVLALAAVAAQIALGGWLSSHQGALACTGFPACNGAWWPAADWAGAFGGGAPGPEARVAMHWAHRLGAGLAGLAVLALAWRLPGRLRAGLLALLTVQLALGAANVLAGLPMAVAVAHTVGAALLLAVLVRIRAGRAP
jgi:cytochrome c oxidase assembly protein subunit 15